MKEDARGRAGGTQTKGFAWHRIASSLVATLLSFSAQGQTLDVPARPEKAANGAEFLRRIAALDFKAREEAIFTEIMAGNVPNFLRAMARVEVANVSDGHTNRGTIYVTPDYLAVGSDQDYYLVHMSPNTAQKIADALDCSLPTRKMVDDIYKSAAVKLAPTPIPPTPAMTTVSVFSNHNAIVKSQRAAELKTHPLGALVAGHQKDVVIAAGLASAPGKVAIYGWHQPNGKPIQPLYLKHAAGWVDYSQCIRLVRNKMEVKGNGGALQTKEERTVREVLADPELCGLLSDEGTLPEPRYPTIAVAGLPAGTNQMPVDTSERLAGAGFRGFQRTNTFKERLGSFTFEPGVKIQINAPPARAFKRGKKLLLIFYALPNGNTTEQTIGRVAWPGEDWRLDIQHIGAQTRFLRELLPERTVVVVYLEADSKSWPAWRKQHGDKMIPEIVGTVRKTFAADADLEMALTSHSGGGSFIFGYLNALDAIPRDVARIAFLDSNYAYDPALGHKDKFIHWLRESANHYLCVLAYNDAVALLDGKSFVSAGGGTWGKTHAMMSDLGEEFRLSSVAKTDLEWVRGLEGQIQFVLKANPERKIYHTVQVERNGFIHAMLSGTDKENRGYEYFGERAYGQWVGE